MAQSFHKLSTFLHVVHVLNVFLLVLRTSLYFRVGGGKGGGICRLGGRFTAPHVGAARVYMVGIANLVLGDVACQ
jgi:hypothetical protein